MLLHSAEVSFCHIVDFDFFHKTRFAETMAILNGGRYCRIEHDVSEKYVRIKRNVMKKTNFVYNSKAQLKFGYMTRYLLEMSLWDPSLLVYTPQTLARAVVSTTEFFFGYTKVIEGNRVIQHIGRRLHELVCSPLLNPSAPYMGNRNKTFQKYSKVAFLRTLRLIPPLYVSDPFL